MNNEFIYHEFSDAWLKGRQMLCIKYSDENNIQNNLGLFKETFQSSRLAPAKSHWHRQTQNFKNKQTQNSIECCKFRIESDRVLDPGIFRGFELHDMISLSNKAIG